MKLTLLMIAALCSHCLYAQRMAYTVTESEKKKIIDTMKILNNKPAHIPISNDTKVMRIFSGYIKCDKKSIPSFQLNYLDSLMINDTSLYWLYNYTDSAGYKIIGQFSREFGMILVHEKEIDFLNDVSKYFDLNEINLVSIVGVGNCIVDEKNIWLINGNTQTDISTFMKEAYKLQDFTDRVLQRTVWSNEDFPFVPQH
jgi:hypothetical protein